jgi:hypothetical protein
MAISCSLSDVSERTSEIAAFLIHQNKDGLRLLLLFRCKTGPRLLEDVSCLLRWDSMLSPISVRHHPSDTLPPIMYIPPVERLNL